MFRLFLVSHFIIAKLVVSENLYSWNNNYYNIIQQQQAYTRRTMKLNENPCENFFTYSCGNWSSVVNIPEEAFEYQVKDVVKDEILRHLNETFSNETFFQNAEDADIILRTHEYYNSCMNVDLLTRRGIVPLVKLIESFGTCPALNSNWNESNSDWIKLIAQLRLLDEDYLIDIKMGTDFLNSSNNILYIDQPLLEINDRNFYKNPTKLLKYKNRLEDIIRELGGNQSIAERISQEILDFEMKLANISRNNDEKGHRSQIYNKTTIGELQDNFPLVNWKKYLLLLQINPMHENDPVMIENHYLDKLMKILAHVTPGEIYNYVLLRFALSKRRMILTSKNAIPGDWWRTCVELVIENMELEVGHIFGKSFLQRNEQDDVILITNRIKKKFEEILRNSSWVDDKTKRLTINKLKEMTIKVGIPDWLKKRPGRKRIINNVSINKDKFFETSIELIRLSKETEFINIVDVESIFDPQEINARYDIGTNKIVISAGLLQPPFYHPSFPQYQKYGILGFILAHEISHGFDNIGINYDHKGEARPWWSEKSLMEYNNRIKCFIRQYDNLMIDGIYSLPENIADNVGINIAFLAYEDWLEIHRKTSLIKQETLEGVNLTSKQLFFVNFVQWRCEEIWGMGVKLMSPNDPHPPEKVRVAGTLANSIDFAKHFQCGMNKNICNLW